MSGRLEAELAADLSLAQVKNVLRRSLAECGSLRVANVRIAFERRAAERTVAAALYELRQAGEIEIDADERIVFAEASA